MNFCTDCRTFMKVLGIFLGLLLSAQLSWAIDTIVVGKSLLEEHVVGGSALEIFEDKDKSITITDILNGNPKFTLNHKPFASNENLSSAYWLKIILRNDSEIFKHFILESYSLNTYSLQLYYVDEKGFVHRQETGEAIPYPDRTHQHKNLVLDLPMPENGGERIFYIRVYSDHTSGFDFHIKSLNWFLFYSNNEYYLLGFYYGILCIMAVYNLIIFLTIRARVHLYYVFYIVSGIFASLNEDKLGFQFLWRESPALNPVLAYHITPAALIITFALYALEFLNLRKMHKNFWYGIIGATGLYMVLFTINIFFTIGDPLRFFYVLPFLVICAASLNSLLKGYRAARLFVVGATFILLSIILIQLRALGLMEGNILTVYLLNYSLVIESVILSIALSDRIKLIQRDKEKAQLEVIRELRKNERLQNIVTRQLQEKHLLQEKVNRELEEKVQERTLELKQANEQIRQMNELLDADNKKLEINVQELSKARIMLKGVDFEEFSKIYPDEDSCYRFLSDLKWKNGYKCKKCGYGNFCEGQTEYSRRCTKCRYDESATAYTIFQGIKFPINKAFYILFLFYSSKEKLTSTEISRILFLRQKTCWSFIHKIVETRKNKTASPKKSKIDGWPSLVLD
jgi:two-component system, sensor histidine kinase LadS